MILLYKTDFKDKVYTVQCTVYSVQCTVYGVQCTLYTLDMQDY